ncbi:DUF6660 family protein [Hymenobacter convexus]|uniref:DUF6660 family protein n=1 Tax=Hymenobacter sp. CA1UV-4 TaxID=3063782 RepID=UPI0027123B64|nr:DUF6660 family protein [Hymenobacter sp. CA1UV-4]MDO7854405.1 hypothetical protein [Hymenobacter sp. CA1UV-4]
MRLFALLLSLYLTCLSCMPCADEAEVCVAQAQASISATPHSDCGQNGVDDSCSPLCQCHCCAGAVLAPSKPVQLAIAAPEQWVSGLYHARLLVAAPTRSTADVWQPPRA